MSSQRPKTSEDFGVELSPDRWTDVRWMPGYQVKLCTCGCEALVARIRGRRAV